MTREEGGGGRPDSRYRYSGNKRYLRQESKQELDGQLELGEHSRSSGAFRLLCPSTCRFSALSEPPKSSETEGRGSGTFGARHSSVNERRFIFLYGLSPSPREIALVQFSEPGRRGRLLLFVRPSSVSFTHFDSENDKTQKKGRKTERKEGRTRSKSDTASRAPPPTLLPPKEPLPSAFPNPPNSRNNVSLIDGFWLHHTIYCTCARNSKSA